MNWTKGAPTEPGRYLCLLPGGVARPTCTRCGEFGTFRETSQQVPDVLATFRTGFKPDGFAGVYRPDEILYHFGPIPEPPK